MADPFLHHDLLDRQDSPGPIPEEYSQRPQESQRAIAPTRTYGPQSSIAPHNHNLAERQPPNLRAEAQLYLSARQPNPLISLQRAATAPSSVAAQTPAGPRPIQAPTNRRLPFPPPQQTINQYRQPAAPQQQRARIHNPHNNGNQFAAGYPAQRDTGSAHQACMSQAYPNYPAQGSSSLLQPHGHQNMTPYNAAQIARSQSVPQIATQGRPRTATPTARGSKPSVKHLTCWWWNEKGQCRYSEKECLYAHRQTESGKVADAPRQVRPGEPPVAGKSLEKALQEAAGARALQGREREMGTLSAQNTALREACAALATTTARCLSVSSTLRQSLVLRAGDVGEAERARMVEWNVGVEMERVEELLLGVGLEDVVEECRKGMRG
ncbi:hypothetical protein FQN50_006501 [Emmonsiellopsis sp. PD_5]|nr:hypothetical protein FQN50_006501 [Emmonsiellopsis sp. PD_5]